ncbi:MAG TPA: hypothetical protein VMF11_00875 [Candidatus Baltobacteraceae bacterium]|nr:hypothetical protein [Candidatus Baltobacteraceae bacterium]
MASTSLTGIFAPGSPALVESLRTLVLEPSRVVAPGEEIRATFSFSNLGGAPATGVRVRFAHPQGVDHLAAGDAIDGAALAEGTLVDANGALIGDLEPNGQRRVSCVFRVNATIEDGSELVFQAALVTDQTPLVASNIERLFVRSRPELENSATFVTIAAPSTPRPGDAITVRAVVRNTGSSSAHDVIVVLPAPDHTTYVARSARIDGRVVGAIDGEVFDYDSATIVSERLAPAQSVVIEYQATIDSPLADATRIKAAGTVGSRETSEFSIGSNEIVVASPVDFDGEDTSFMVLSDDVVVPGMRIPMLLRAMNVGTGIAERVQIAFTLPQGLIYAPGTAHVDGQPVSDDAIANLTFSLGSLAAGRMIEAGLSATVAVPTTAELALPVDAALRWKGGERTFTRRLSVRVAPRFSRARNYVEADRGVVQAREELAFTVHVFNDGTAPESDVRLRLTPGLYLTDVRIGESADDTIPYDVPVALGFVHPHQERAFTVLATIASRVPDRSTVTLGAILEHGDGAIDLGTASAVVRSRPSVESVAWELVSHEPLRPGRTVDAIVRVHNSGSDVLRDARLSLTLPPELAIERAVDARRDREGLAFTDIAAETTHESRMTLRLLRAVPNNRTLALEGWLHGKGISPVQFAPLDVTTYAQAQFAQSAQILAIPSENVNAGERLYYEIRLRNDGDGPADRLTVRVVATNLAVYVPASTTINGMAIPDDAGVSQLWSARGLVLADVNPNLDLRVRWEMMVMSPLAAGTALDSRAILEWGEGTTFAVAAPTVRVQAQPSLSESTAGTPLSIARIFPSEQIAVEAPPLPEPEPIPEPPPPVAAQPRALQEIVETIQSAQPAVPVEETVEVAQARAVSAPVLYVDFSPERLTNTLRMLERSNSAGGLVQHLFALRLLFPEHAQNAPASVDEAFANAARALRAPLEKLFVRLRMPRLTITGKDLEDRESRDALRDVVESLSFAPTASPAAPADGVVRVAGAVELDVIRTLLPDLESSPLGAVTPWLINAQVLGGIVYHGADRSEALEQYRGELLRVLSVLDELPIEEFHRVITSSVNRTLDDALTQAIESLRGAARVATE